jgi:nucleoside-diphosphate-sugar epimerase
MSQAETVLVTGASGYIAQHCILQLLEQGYRVRGTLRSSKREAELRAAISKHVDVGDRLELVVADLVSDDGWAEAARGCTYVLHTASPIPPAEPKDENEVIKPAVEGTLRVLKAAAAAGVRRVVVTSSVAAIVAGHPASTTFDESHWSDLQAGNAYQRSKTLAEKAAWDFVAQHPALELATINPVYVIGPSLDGHYSISADIIGALMQGRYPATPRLGFSMVDVRDVAAAHLSAMTTPEAAGKRFICHIDFMWMKEIAQLLKTEFSRQGYRISTFPIPDVAMRVIALFDGTIRMLIGQLGRQESYNTAQIRQVLKWSPRPIHTSILDTARNMIEVKAV